MTASTATLPLYWSLSSDKSERLDASVKLVSSLQIIQENFVEEKTIDLHGADAANFEELDTDPDASALDTNNAPDVAYAIRRLIRGLASPRESSRIGFAVALTELLSRIDTVTCMQVLSLVKTSSHASGSMTGQEERDMLFARLFGLKAINQAGLLFRQKPLKSSSTSSSSIAAFEVFLTELLALGEKKSWLKESCWWTLLSVVDSLHSAEVTWKTEALKLLLNRIFVDDKTWCPEKIAILLKLQTLYPSQDWQVYCSPVFKVADVLATVNLPILGSILKDSASKEYTGDEETKNSSSPWKPQLHFVWDAVLDFIVPPDISATNTRTFENFYRIVVDGSLFSTSSSSERKYWGFQLFEKAVSRLPPTDLPIVFTRNFMSTWMYHLAKEDRYLHKIARQTISTLEAVARQHPSVGATIVLQLTGQNGSYQFDRITKTKTVENMLASMDEAGIKKYIDYLLSQFDQKESEPSTSVETCREWVIDQLAIILRKGSIVKSSDCIGLILTWFTTHSFFDIVKRSKSANVSQPDPPISKATRKLCRTKLLACLGDTIGSKVLHEQRGNSNSGETQAVQSVSTDECVWVTLVNQAFEKLEKDTKHFKLINPLNNDKRKLRENALQFTTNLKASKSRNEASQGIELLILGLLLIGLLHDEEADWENLRDAVDSSKNLFPGLKEHKRKSLNTENSDDKPPIDLIVDIIIGLLEQATTFSRTLANQSFSMLTSLIESTSIELILTQLEKRDPTENVMDEDEDMDSDEEPAIESGSESSSESASVQGSEDLEEAEDKSEEGDTEELRKALEIAVSGNAANDKLGVSSDEESMDDEQMMEIDEKLAAIFRTRAEARKSKITGAQREATYFKNRVLDLVDTVMKKQSSNKFIFQFILPLVDLASAGGTEERQLSDKAKGILRARLAKGKEVPDTTDVELVDMLEALHQRARRANSAANVSIIGWCSLFIAKCCFDHDKKAVLRIYDESISDFMKRKASSISPAFVMEFIRRYPLQAWELRKTIIDLIPDAVNGYRQYQAFVFIKTILQSLPQPNSLQGEITSYVQSASQALRGTVLASCNTERPLLSAVHMKECMKVGLQICRYSKRFAAENSMTSIWEPDKWEALSQSLSSAENFKAIVSLTQSCQQICKLAGSASTSNIRKKSENLDTQTTEQKIVKRKSEIDAGDEAREKPKRKRLREPSTD